MIYPDVTVPALSIEPTKDGYVERIAGMRLAFRARSGRHARPITLTILTDAGDVHRHLTGEDLIAIRDWCDRAIDAQNCVIYPDEYPETAE